MREQPVTEPVPVEGEVVNDSPIKMFLTCLFVIFVLAPFGALVVWAWWTEFSFADHQVAWYGAFLGGLCVLGGIGAVPVALLCFFRRTKLILGGSCLQVLRGEKVTVQIPYTNIARMGDGESQIGNKYIGIDLRDPKASGTLCPGAETSKNGHGWHYTLDDDFWSIPLPQIHERLVAKLAASGHIDNAR